MLKSIVDYVKTIGCKHEWYHKDQGELISRTCTKCGKVQRFSVTQGEWVKDATNK